MTDEPGGIQPALTPEEWGQVSRASAGDFNTAPMAYGFSQVLGDRRHATAALCLYGQPFGFDGEELNCPAATIVEALDRIAEVIDLAVGNKMIGVVNVQGPGGSFMLPAFYPDMLRALAIRIAALLPLGPR